MAADFQRFFEEYAEAFNRSLEGSLDFDAISAAYADVFIRATSGEIRCGRNGEEFRAVLEHANAFYREIGNTRTAVRGVEAAAIDEQHHLVRVRYRSDYEPRSGERIQVDYHLTYLLQSTAGERPRIFGLVGGDETAQLRAHGLV